jgi:hypothetical protein
MIKRPLVGIALLAAAVGLAMGEEAGKTDPDSGKSCVSLLAAERTQTGLMLMHYRNICDSEFGIQIKTEKVTRKGTIKAGTAKKPGKAIITCKSSDECDRSEWKYE